MVFVSYNLFDFMLENTLKDPSSFVTMNHYKVIYGLDYISGLESEGKSITYVKRICIVNLGVDILKLLGGFLLAF